MLSFVHSKLLHLLSLEQILVNDLPTAPHSVARRRHRPTVCDHRLITDHFTHLKFHCAAYLQLQYFPPPQSDPENDWTPLPRSELLIASPYNHPAHLLDLSLLETPYQLLAKALTALKPIRPDYATATYTSSFNWQAVTDLLQDLAMAEEYDWKELRFHVVIFRSKLNLASKRRSELSHLDQHSHEEAIKSGGLLKYWFGNADEEGRNLATCIWRNKDDSKRGSSGKDHRLAMLAAMEIYEVINFQIVSLKIGDGASSWEFEGEGEI